MLQANVLGNGFWSSKVPRAQGRALTVLPESRTATSENLIRGIGEIRGQSLRVLSQGRN